jgi:hypothetical protein
MRTKLEQAQINYRRARTHHNRMQNLGETTLSPIVTRKMALAVSAMQRAHFKLLDAEREYEYQEQKRKNTMTWISLA